MERQGIVRFGAPVGAVGSIVATLACMTCFSGAVPFVATLVGISGVAAFTALRAYNPWLLAIAGIAIFFSVRRVIRNKRNGIPSGRLAVITTVASLTIW